jgi:hypothetical protein
MTAEGAQTPVPPPELNTAARDGREYTILRRAARRQAPPLAGLHPSYCAGLGYLSRQSGGNMDKRYNFPGGDYGISIHSFYIPKTCRICEAYVLRKIHSQFHEGAIIITPRRPVVLGPSALYAEPMGNADEDVWCPVALKTQGTSYSAVCSPYDDIRITTSG